ncbi:hypothetical protein M426DRAFT_11411 [Hypoxylon sp. CI-4A]|nr:hypothetical protein M426DRAFT_11411 [Hypoxylon sp. CI-4A]
MRILTMLATALLSATAAQSTPLPGLEVNTTLSETPGTMEKQIYYHTCVQDFKEGGKEISYTDAMWFRLYWKLHVNDGNWHKDEPVEVPGEITRYIKLWGHAWHNPSHCVHSCIPCMEETLSNHTRNARCWAERGPRAVCEMEWW